MQVAKAMESAQHLISAKKVRLTFSTSAPVLYCGKLWNVAPSQHDGILSAHDAAVVLGYHKKHVGQRANSNAQRQVQTQLSLSCFSWKATRFESTTCGRSTLCRLGTLY